MQQVNVNVNVGGPGPMQMQRKTGCLLQVIYFLFIGCWLGALAIIAAYLCFALVLTIPLGVKIINRISYLMALREPPMMVSPWGTVEVRQHNLLLRAIWFFVIGLWLTGLWMAAAYLLCCTIIGMPVGFWMFDRAPALLTLRRS